MTCSIGSSPWTLEHFIWQMGRDSILYWGQNIGTLKRWNIRFVKWKVIPYCTEDKTLEHCNISVVKLVVIPYCDLAL